MASSRRRLTNEHRGERSEESTLLARDGRGDTGRGLAAAPSGGKGTPGRYRRCAQMGATINAVIAVLAVAEIILAINAGHLVGVVVGVLSAMLAAGRAMSRVVGKPELPRWGVAVVLVLQIVLYAWVILLFAVRVLSFAPAETEFPISCGERTNCARISNTTYRADNQTAPWRVAQGGCSAVVDFARAYEKANFTSVLNTSGNGTFCHAYYTSALMGFVNDFYYLVKCDGGLANGTVIGGEATGVALATLANATIWVQSSSRLGRDDFGVNTEVVENFRAAFLAADLS